MKRYHTQNSTYDVHETADGIRVKREGEPGPFRHALSEPGVWKAATGVEDGPYGGLVIFTADGAVWTSRVLSVEEIPA